MPGVAEGAGILTTPTLSLVKTYLGGYDFIVDARHISDFDVIIIFHQVS